MYAHKYSAALIEKSEGHSNEFFSKRDNWTVNRRQEVLSFPEHQRFVCRSCREDYAFQLVLQKLPPEVQTAETVEDLLHGDLSYKQGAGYKGEFNPSFYSAGAFNSARVGDNARAHYQLLSALDAQDILEEGRYFLLKHGSYKGFKERFIFGYFLEGLFNVASSHAFPVSGRAPVGLNPERFVARCQECNQWLHGREFNVQYCDRCAESKPAAVDI